MATTKRDYYDVLDIDRSASEEDIKKAFRKLAFQYHPDRNSDAQAETRFKEINEAYEVLSDPEKRANYDRFGADGAQGFGRGFEGVEGFGGFGDIFDAFFGGTTTRTRQGRQQGEDLRYRLELDFEDAIFGAEKEIEIRRIELCTRCRGLRSEPGTQPARCKTCNGSGQVRRVQQSVFGQFASVATCPTCRGEGQRIITPCSECRGAGREQKTKKVLVTIPPGVDTGNQLRLTGEGDAGAWGGPPGSLYVVISVREHDYFERRGDDILFVLPLNIAQAALGDTVAVPTIEGAADLKIPPGTQSAQVFRLKGKGVQRLQGSGRGDELVAVRVAIPETLTDDQRRLLGALAKTFDSQPQSQEDRGFLDKIKDALNG